MDFKGIEEKDVSNYLTTAINKGKAISVPVLTIPDDSRSSKLPDFMRIGTWRLQDCQPYAPAAFTPQAIFLVLICVKADATPWP